MPIKVRFLIVVLVLFNYSAELSAQDSPMSQYYHQLFALNPAYAGASGGGRFSSFYRQQWAKVDEGFEYYGATYDQVLRRFNSGFGFVLKNEVSGAIVTPSIELAYAYHIKASDKLTVSMGLQGGIIQKYIKTEELKFELDELISSGINKRSADFSAGIAFLFDDKLFGGFAMNHLNRPEMGTENTSSKLGLKYTMQIGYVLDVERGLSDKRIAIMPNFMIQIQDKHQNISWGVIGQYDVFLLGLLVRHNIYANFDVLIFSAGFKTKQLRIAYSYDINIGKQSILPLGSHEISMTFVFDTQSKKKPKALSCPSFLK